MFLILYLIAFQNHELFVDDSFPPLPKSLYYNPEEPREESVDQWLRPNEITCDPYEEQIKWAVFRTPMPSDISQGDKFLCLNKKICGKK